MMEGFEARRDAKGWVPKKNKFKDTKTKKDKKVINILISVLPNNILLKIDKYKDASDLWEKVVNLYESLLLVQK